MTSVEVQKSPPLHTPKPGAKPCMSHPEPFESPHTKPCCSCYLLRNSIFFFAPSLRDSERERSGPDITGFSTALGGRRVRNHGIYSIWRLLNTEWKFIPMPCCRIIKKGFYDVIEGSSFKIEWGSSPTIKHYHYILATDWFPLNVYSSLLLYMKKQCFPQLLNLARKTYPQVATTGAHALKQKFTQDNTGRPTSLWKWTRNKNWNKACPRKE